MRALVFLAALSVACGGASPVTKPAVVAPPAAPSLADQDASVLRVLAAADVRFARRAGVVADESQLRAAGVQAILAEDTTTVMEGGRPDLFSFDARARALDEAAKMVAEYTQKDPKNALELERLGALVRSEQERLTRERALPSGAPALLRGVAETWTEGGSAAEGEQHDVRLSKRFELVRGSLVSVSPEVRDELEASLDPIEAKLSPAFGRSQRELVKLRVRLGEVPVDGSPPKPSRVAEDGVEAKLRADLAKLRELAGKDAPVVLDTTPCRYSSEGSMVGKLMPPPEREDLCAIVRALRAGPPSGALLAALHDRVVVAVWAIRIAAGVPAHEAIGSPRPLAEATPHHEGALTRLAALRPEEAISTALAIDWLMGAGVAEAQKRAEKWDAFGDAAVALTVRELQR